MRNFKLFLIIVGLFALIMFPSSCTKDDVGNSKFEQPQMANETFMRPLGDCSIKERFAKTLSKSLKEIDVTNFVIDNSLRLENGDPTFLFGLSYNKRTDTGVNFSDRMAIFDEIKDKFYQDIIKNNPLLSIFVYVPKGTEINKDIKFKKVYYYCSTDESKGPIFYFVNGVKFSSDISELPTEPVIVVLPNDRIAITKANLNFIQSHNRIGTSKEFDYFLTTTHAKTIDNSRPQVSENSNRTCQRDLFKQREGVQRFLFSDDLESWLLGGPEIKIDMLMLQSGSASLLSNVYSLSGSQQGSWVLLNHKPITWFTNIYGQDYMRYHISEQDGAANQGAYTFGLTIAGVGGLNFSFGNNADDLYGMSDIYYCDWVSPSTWGALYFAGSDAQFWVNTY